MKQLLSVFPILLGLSALPVSLFASYYQGFYGDYERDDCLIHITVSEVENHVDGEFVFSHFITFTVTARDGFLLSDESYIDCADDSVDLTSSDGSDKEYFQSGNAYIPEVGYRADFSLIICDEKDTDNCYETEFTLTYREVWDGEGGYWEDGKLIIEEK